MSGPAGSPVDNQPYDVAVIGAGIAGLAACVLLRQRGFRVLCGDAVPCPHQKVGESLDWSSPALLARLGIDTRRLLHDGIATDKRRIVVCERGQPEWGAAPPPVIARSPLRFETATLHVDRTAIDLLVYEQALALGTTFEWARVARVECEGDRVTACTTTDGRTLRASWFIDASGTARLFSRALDIPIVSYGRPKVCLWTYFDTPPLNDGTTFFVENDDDYLRWVWDIPITPSRTSVGFVLSADVVRERRHAGGSPEEILLQELRRHPRFDGLLTASPAPEVSRTTFQPYVTSRVCGGNWLIVGEAASMPDPLTGNGFTSGIRHARHAVEAIASSPGGTLSPARQRLYSRHVQRLGHSFNDHIERAVYQPHVRRAFGLRIATYVYTLFAFFTNALQARFDPRGPVATGAFALPFAAARAWIGAWSALARVALWLRPRTHVTPAPQG